MTKIITFLIVACIFACCQNTQKTTNTPSETINPENMPAKTDNSEKTDPEIETYRFNVSFISIGSGRDFEALKIFRQFLSEYNADKKVVLDYVESPWGREGEIDFCFPLNTFSPKEQLNFIHTVKDLLAESSLIRYNENADCNRSHRK